MKKLLFLLFILLFDGHVDILSLKDIISQAIIELREALKIEANNSVCHGALELASFEEQ
ncbi:MAG: hypothetical protein ACP8RL_01120 [cyanobacterium endosymbiont of Rhopalodia inflata]